MLLEPALFFKDSRGTGGKEALQIAKEISRQGRKEVESQRKKLSRSKDSLILGQYPFTASKGSSLKSTSQNSMVRP